jgi:hypothetical protein
LEGGLLRKTDSRVPLINHTRESLQPYQPGTHLLLLSSLAALLLLTGAAAVLALAGAAAPLLLLLLLLLLLRPPSMLPMMLDMAKPAKGVIKSRITAPAPSTVSAGVAAPLSGSLPTGGGDDLPLLLLLLLLLLVDEAALGAGAAVAAGAAAGDDPAAFPLSLAVAGSSGLTILGGVGAR